MDAFRRCTVAGPLIAAAAVLPDGTAAGEAKRDYPVRPVPFTEVKIDDGVAHLPVPVINEDILELGGTAI